MRKSIMTLFVTAGAAAFIAGCAGGNETMKQGSAKAETPAEAAKPEAMAGENVVDSAAIKANETQTQITFPRGTKIQSDRFIGGVYLKPMIMADSAYKFQATNSITFEPGARSSWHQHGGMIVLATGGVGYYQEEGKKAQILRKGDVVQIPTGVKHWHGAAADSWFSQIVIYDSKWQGAHDEGKIEHVSAEEFAKLETEEYTGRDAVKFGDVMFNRAEKPFESPYFNGDVYVSNILDDNNAAGTPGLHYVVFDKGVYNNWHSHAGGQVLIATDGIGFHQIEGEPVQVLHPGDVAICPPGVKHWHGGSQFGTFAHIAASADPTIPGVDWLPTMISEDEYKAVHGAAGYRADAGGESALYPTVKIGDQVWLATNLKSNVKGSYCYGDDEANCKAKGRLYTWEAATKACPAGFHLPDTTEWNALVKTAGGAEAAFDKLRAKTGWIPAETSERTSLTNGTDEYQFTAIPTGSRHHDGAYFSKEQTAYFWTATDYVDGNAHFIYIRENRGDKIGFSIDRKGSAFAVRCVQD